MKDTKKLRRDKLKQRDALSPLEREEKSGCIAEKLLGIEEVKSAHHLFIYVSFRSEVSTFELLNRFMDQGKKISVPLTLVEEKRMEAVRLNDIASDLEPGYCDILEPRKAIWQSNRTSPEDIDVVVVPGSVFDERGGRFGYGGGYYDRFLENIPQALRVGLAYEIQLVREIPLQPHDQLMDYVLTEARAIQGKRE